MRFTILPALISLMLPLSAIAAPSVVVSIKPLHSLAANLMQGVSDPQLLVDGSTSLHEFQMKPSHAAMVSKADIVFYLDEHFESFLPQALKNLTADASAVAVVDAARIPLLPLRQSGAWAAHTHAGHAHEHHAHEHQATHEHTSSMDYHVWLNPQYAKAMAAVMRDTLIKKDAANAKSYDENFNRLSRQLDALDAEVAAQLKPYASAPFVLFHDALQYVETHYDLNAAGSVMLTPDVAPTPARLKAVRDSIASAKVACVFSEPMASPKLIDAVADGGRVRVVAIDPEATMIPASTGLYEASMRALAAQLTACLKP